MLHALFFAAMILGIVSVRARLMGANGGVVPRTTPRLIFSTLTAVLTVTIVVWGFLTFSWYWPLAVLLFANIVIIALVTNGAWPVLCRCVPLIDVMAVVLGLTLWIAYWPLR